MTKSKRKIFFLLFSMNVGGVEKSFLNLINGYNPDKYEIHLGLYKVSGGYLDWLPKEVIIHHIDCFDKYIDLIEQPPQQSLIALLKKGKFFPALQFLGYVLLDKFFHTRLPFYNFIMRNEPDFPIDFDIAIAYASPEERTDYYICKKVKAKIKYAWIHFDINKFGYNTGIIRNLYRSYKKIFIVSESAKEAFDRTFPQFANKTDVRHNIIDRDLIIKQAKNGPTFDDNYFGTRILTVGRISPEKGQDLAIRVASLLKKGGFDFKWYFVGDGKFRKECERLVEELDLSNNTVFLGLQTNPYAYMRDCDIYVQPSLHEGFCITLGEAICFNHPIVTTDFCGAKEQLIDYSQSSVCNHNVSEIVRVIKSYF